MLKQLKNLSELVVFEHTIFSSAFILIAMVVAARGWFGYDILLLCALALISARNFAMAINRYVDIDIDKQNPRTKSRPSVDGRISPLQILVFAVINAVLFVIVSYFINNLAFILSLPFLFILGIYSYFKRFSTLAHFILGISLSLAPIAGVIAVLGYIPLWSIFLAIGVMLWVAGFDLLYSLQDMNFDKKNGLFSIPAIYGAKNTLIISRICHIFACLFWLLFVIYSNGGILAYIGLMCAILMLCYEHYLVRKDFLNIPKAFFQTNGYLGFIFLLFIVLDNVF
ncbi:menaquinone biosynthesis prenyltransferase MqnP [Helicobacter sp. MIT 99-5507]|uniref:menaquinone biosynthesis prenyltransferase MqnP n=1 Tax=Helicobacter sp. MIT 99-5507 TaxID=152489 RepID=UPI000E1F15F8|nr:menaquinone biosynthesis prenyltransferase MqnP [Helicobacter sp. MIT 99-5507]RDU56641.1 4-hydroxybenzoate polyprenyltransferase [Helicobacter sp. MIT 99-5507]